MEIVANKEVIALNQGNPNYSVLAIIKKSCLRQINVNFFVDPHGVQAKKARMEGDLQVG